MLSGDPIQQPPSTPNSTGALVGVIFLQRIFERSGNAFNGLGQVRQRPNLKPTSSFLELVAAITSISASFGSFGGTSTRLRPWFLSS
jgi:hypothetical protein